MGSVRPEHYSHTNGMRTLGARGRGRTDSGRARRRDVWLCLTSRRPLAYSRLSTNRVRQDKPRVMWLGVWLHLWVGVLGRNGGHMLSDRARPGRAQCCARPGSFASSEQRRERLCALLRSTSLARSTVHVLLAGMRAVGLVVEEEAHDRYRLGLMAVQLGARALASEPLVAPLSPGMQQLAEEPGGTVSLSIRIDRSVVFVKRCEPRHHLCTNITVGSPMPLCAVASPVRIGDAVLAALSTAGPAICYRTGHALADRRVTRPPARPGRRTVRSKRRNRGRSRHGGLMSALVAHDAVQVPAFVTARVGVWDV